MSAKKINEEVTLEEAMKRLSEVVKQLDSDGTDLEGSLKLYEEGVALVRLCNEKLQAAERRISVLRISSEGEIKEENFDAQKG